MAKQWTLTLTCHLAPFQCSLSNAKLLRVKGKSIIVIPFFFSFLSSLVVCWHQRVASCLNRRDGRNLQEVFGMVVSAFCAWDGGDLKLCIGRWRTKIVHGTEGNEICAWDDGQWKQCMKWWWIITVLGMVTSAWCACCIRPWFVNFLVLVVLKIFSSNNTVQQKRPADGTRGAVGVKL